MSKRGGMDAFDRKHLKTWLREAVFSEDRRKVGKIIRNYVRRHPEVIGQSRSWPEIQRLAEASGTNPRDVGALQKKREARERAAQIRAAAGRNNPRRVFWDPSINKYTAHKFLSKHGNIIASGETKAAAVRNLKAAIARAKGGSHNPEYLYFEMNGRKYRTDGAIVEGKDGSTWNQTGSLPVVLKARELWQAARTNPAELLVMGANPRVEVVHGDNPPVEEIAEEFSGTEVKYLDVYNEPHIPRGSYGFLAKLMRLLIKPAKGGQVQRITFPEDARPMIVSDSTGKQLYFVEGGQDMTACLEAFGAQGRFDGLLELGQAREIHYWGVKHHIGDEDTEEWRHKHGEENGALPTVLFDTRNKRLLYEGGDYRVEGPWIHN